MPVSAGNPRMATMAIGAAVRGGRDAARTEGWEAMTGIDTASLATVAAYRREGRTVTQIVKITGVSDGRIYRIIRRCVSVGLLAAEDEARRKKLAKMQPAHGRSGGMTPSRWLEDDVL